MTETIVECICADWISKNLRRAAASDRRFTARGEPEETAGSRSGMAAISQFESRRR